MQLLHDLEQNQDLFVNQFYTYAIDHYITDPNQFKDIFIQILTKYEEFNVDQKRQKKFYTDYVKQNYRNKKLYSYLDLVQLIKQWIDIQDFNSNQQLINFQNVVEKHYTSIRRVFQQSAFENLDKIHQIYIMNIPDFVCNMFRDGNIRREQKVSYRNSEQMILD